MVLSQEFPYLPTTYEIERVVTSSKEILVQARSRRRTAECPRCGKPSSRVHSRYLRRLWEQPCAGRRVRLILTLQRFRCVNTDCRRCTFVEPLEGLAQRHAQRTIAQGQALQAVGLALGGMAGALLARRLGLAAASPSTLLRQIRRVALPVDQAPRVVGLDDWAWRRGKRYGSIVVDLERGQPVDLLADYSVEALAAWLLEHPQVRVVVRDRAPTGIGAARQGAPQAVQVADRFHLLKNLTDQLAAGFERHPPRRPRAPPAQDSAGAQRAQQPKTSKEHCYHQMQQLRAAGWSIRAIASQVDTTRSTVHRWLAHGCPQADWVRKVHRHTHPGPPGSTEPLPGSRQAAFLFVRLPDALPQRQREQLSQLLESRPELEPLYQLAQRFVRLLTEHDVTALVPWLQEAKRCAWSQVRELARGLWRDLAAVQAALTLPYSNGPVEGQITRLKLLKRQAYGRASVDLLRRRLLASC